ERAEQSVRRLQEQVELGSLPQAQMRTDRLLRNELEAELEKARKETHQSVAEAQSLLQQKRSEVEELRATSRTQQEQLAELRTDLEESVLVHEKMEAGSQFLEG
ncbi:unnamed protein product, partial [Symbiodinium natans]